jgi:hypothetical protein
MFPMSIVAGGMIRSVVALVVDRGGTQRHGVNPLAVAGVVRYALRGQALPKHRDEGREIPL